MALVLADRVQETCSSPGTGTATLLGAVTGFQTFLAAIGNGNTCYYTIADQSGGNWEVGIGTVGAGTLARTTVLSSSNGGSATNFSTGTQNVFVTYPSEIAAWSSNNPGSSGQVLTSNGTGVAPSWQSAGGGSTIYGEISGYPSGTLPTGYIPANGTPVLQASYPNLVGILPDYMTTSTGTFSNSACSALVYANSKFLAIPFNKAVVDTSTDGITWTTTGTMPSSTSWRAVTWNGSIYCAVSGATAAATSSDGITWTAQTLPVSATWRGIAWNGSVFCVVASGTNTILTSPNGATWTSNTGAAGLNGVNSSGINQIAWNGSLFCQANNNYISTSPDGATWTIRATTNLASTYSVVWNGSVFCLVAQGSVSGAVAVMTSTDGITWSSITNISPPTATFSWLGATTIGSKIFIIPGNSYDKGLLSVDNGTTWYFVTVPATAGWFGATGNSTIAVCLSTSTASFYTVPDPTKFFVPQVTITGATAMMRAS